MIRTLEVSTETGYKHGISRLINDTLKELGAIKLIDIKYQTVAIDVGDSTIIRTSALIIYKELY